MRNLELERQELAELGLHEQKQTNGGCDAQSGTCVMGFIASVGDGIASGFSAAYNSWSRFLSNN